MYPSPCSTGVSSPAIVYLQVVLMPATAVTTKPTRSANMHLAAQAVAGSAESRACSAARVVSPGGGMWYWNHVLW